MTRAMQIIREVSYQAESCYSDAESLGNHAAHALGGKRRSQMTGLENIAESTLKTTDVLDYIKRQTARHKEWQRNYPDQQEERSLGERLKSYLEADLFKRAEHICDSEPLKIGKATDEDKQARRQVYLLLIQQFIRQMVIQYEYQVRQEA